MLLNRFRFVRGASLAAMSLLAGVGAAQVQVVDGVADYQYNVPLVTQNVDTGYGNNLSELDVAWAYIKDNKLYLTLAGNLENSGNKLNIFIDSVSGGQNRLRGDNLNGGSFWYLTRLGDSGGPNGLLFETGFEADYFFGLNMVGGSPLYVDYSNLPTFSGGSGSYLGAANPIDGVLSGGTNPNNVKANYNGTNTGGVAGGTAAGYAKGGVVATGFELEIPLAAIGNPTGTVRVVAFIGSPDNSSLSNQFLPGVGYNGGPVGNYGEPRGVNLGGTTGSNVGTHYFIVPWAGNGKLALLRMGDGSAALSNAATPVYIDEYATTGGSIVQTVALPSSGGSNRLTNSGTATGEGALSTSLDGLFLVMGGYDAIAGTAGIASTTSGSVPRNIGQVSRTGVASANSGFNGFSGAGIRSATQFEGSLAYTSGANDGIRYNSLGSSTTSIVSSTLTNIRVTSIYNNQLWYSTAAGTTRGIYLVANGLPTSGANAATLAASLGASGAAHGFFFADATTLYIADERTAPAGGVYKFTYSGGVWSQAYNLNTSIPAGYLIRGVTGVRNSSNQIVLYAVCANTSNSSKLLSLTDTGAAAAFTDVMTSPTNTVWRGIQMSHFSAVANQAPVLDAIGGQSGDEETLITFDANATDPDSGQTLTYSLVGAPAGASIDSSTGVFTFTPTEAQGPGSFTFDVVVTDNGTSPLSDTETITVTVNEVNVAPVLDAIGAQSGDEETLITFDANASDVDLPANTLTFSLTGAPAGASIDSNTGVFTWTPTEAQSGSHTFDVVVSDGNLTDTESITVTVNEVNVAPVLDPIGAQSGDEDTLITFDANASDADLPAQTLTFSLIGAPAGATIDANTGVFSWTPTEAQDGSHTFTVKVTDDGSPNLSDEESITVTVNEVNVAPVLDPIGNQTIEAGQPLTFTATGSDSDLPAQALTFSLDSGAPAGATITTGGAFSWKPTQVQVGSFNVTVRLSDGGLDDSETITINVTAPPVPTYSLTDLGVLPGGSSSFAQGVNNDGLVIGYSDSSSGTRAVYWENGTITNLGTLGGTFSLAQGSVTASGQFTGTSTNSGGTQSAMRWTTSSAENLGLSPSATSTRGIDINNLGEVVAYSILAGNGRAVLWRPSGWTDLGTLGGSWAFPASINNLSQVVGYSVDGSSKQRAFVWSPTSGVMSNLGVPAGSDLSRAWDINDSLWIVGEVGNGVTGGFLWANGSFTVLWPWGPANAINESGQVVGNNGSGKGVLYQGGTTHILNDLLDSSGTGYDVVWANDISDNGKIVGYGTGPGGGGYRALLLTPIDPNANQAPVLDPIGGQSGDEETLITFDANATDPNSGDTLTYSLVGAPAGASIDSGTGVFTFTPTEAQGPGSFTFDVVVTDNGTSPLSDSETITVTVNEVNVAPVLDAIGAQSGDEETLITFDANASDVDLPANTLTFSLTGAPAGASIDSNTGVFTWTPTEAQSGSHTFDVVVSDGNLTDTESITVTVNEVNVAPVLDPIGAQSGDEETLITFDANASDADLPAQTLTFSLVGAPSGATIDANTGVFSWTPTEAQDGPHTFTVKVTDDGSPNLSDEESITITVNEVNVAPTADSQSVNVAYNTPQSVTLTGSDTDLPAQTLSFSVVGNPTNGTLSGTAPNLTYTPNVNYSGGDSFTFKVNDGATDSALATVTLTVAAGAPMTIQTFGSPAPNGFGSPSFAGYVANALNSLENGLGDIGDRTVTPTAYEQETQITWRDITVASFPLWLGQLNPASPFDQEFGNRLHFGVRILGNGTLFSLEMLEFDMDSSDPANDLDFNGNFVGFNYSATRFGIHYGPDRVKGGGDDTTYTSGNGTTLVDEIVYVGIGNGWWAQGAGTEAEQLMDARCYIESLAPISVMTTYRINDGVNILGSGSATVTVMPTNVLPTAQDQNVSTPINTPLNVTLVATDPDNEPLDYTVVAGPTNGSLSGTAPNLTYTPNTNFVGVDTFTFKASDCVGDSNVATVTITVQAPDPVEMRIVGTPAPNAFGSPNWNAYIANAITSLKDDLGSTGNRTLDPAGYEEVTQIPWKDIVVSGFNSWRGVAGPVAPFNAEYGNRLHFGVRIQGKGRRIKLSDVEVTMTSSDPNNDLGFSQDFGALSIPYSTRRTGLDYGPDRDRGTFDDFMVTSGPGTTEVDELIFIGLGNAWDATFETGTDQEKLEAVRCYIEELVPIDVTSVYRLKDGLGGYLVTGSATVTVVPTNVLPTAEDQNVSTDEDTPVNITLVATDPDNEPLDYTVVAGPTNGLLSGTAPNLTYTPNANFAGVDSFTFKATDCVGDSNVATVTITVNAINDQPSIATIAPQTVDELTLASFTASGSDPDLGDSLTYSLIGAPAGASIHPTSGAFSWTPTEAQGPGSFTFDVQVTDTGSLSATTSVTITVNEVNVAPVANSQNVTTDEDQAVNITLTGTDDDLPANTLTYTVVDGPTNGNLSGSAPNLTYTPNANYNGSDSFTFKINDGQVDSNIATVTITVDPVNDAPTAENDSYSTAEDTLLDVDAPGVLGNDSDLDVGLTAILVTGPTFGTLNLNSDGSFEYTPQANFNGVDTFTYKANDGQEDSNVATVTITVTPVNDIAVEQFVSAAPNFYGSPSYAGWESNAMNSLENGLGSIGNRATDPTAYEQLGAVTEWGDGVVSGFNSWRGGATPPVPFQAELGNRLHFGVRILGNGTRFKLKNLYNDMNSNDLVNTFDFDGDFVGYPYRPWRKGIDYGPDRAKGGGDDIVYMNGESEDLEVDELIYSGVGNAFDATFGSGTDQEKLNEVRCYISDNQPLIVDNRYEIRDDLGTPMASSTVSVVLDPLNGVPVANDQNVTTDEDTPVNITLTATDPDTDPLTWEIVTPPTFGNLSGTAPNLTYTPNANYAGADSFTFRVNDGICDSNIATVSITVTPVNDVQVQVYGSSAPNFFGSPSFGGYRDNALNGLENGLLSVGDRNTNPTGYEVLTTATWRDIVVAGFPLWRGTINPAAPFDAEYGNRMHFGLRILGNGTRFKLSNLKFDMNSSDPDNSMDFEGDFVGGAYSASRKGIDYGPDRQKGGGDDVVYTNGESGDLEVDEFIYVGIGNAFDATPQGGNTPAEELLLTRCYIENVAPMDVSVAYTICDDLNQPIATGTGTVTIVPSNVLPTADNQSVSVDEDGSVNIDLTASDPDNEPLTFSVMSGPTFGNLSGTAPNLTYTPNANFAGVDSFTFIASDCVGDSNVATITITVNPVNDPPSLEDIAPITVDELTLATFIANAADPDLGDSLMFTLIGAPAGATIHPTSGTFNWTPTEAQGPGVYTFDVQVTDSGSQSATKSVTITVNEVNVAPELTVGNSHTVDEGQLLTFTASATDSDDPANTLTYSLVGAPSGMSINPTSGEITWTPTEAQGPNSYTFTVKVTDDGTPNLSDEESVTVTVNEVNEAPVAQDQTVNTDEDDDVDITLVATDNDLPANTLNYIIVDAPLNGTLSGTAPNLTYTPNANWSGTDTFTFKVTDGTIDSNIATVTINVAPINDAPVAGAPGDASVSQGQNLFLNLSAADVDADPFDVKVSLSVSNGKLSLASNAGLSFLVGDGSMDIAMEFTGSLADVNAALTGLLYKHTPGFNGTDTLVYVLNDLGNSGAGGPLSDTKNVLIDIVPAGAQIFFSSGYIVHAGEEFTGGLSTLLASDDDRLSVFNDPVTLAAAIEFYATSPINCPLELRFRMEHSASRPGLAYFLQLYNYDTNAWDINVGDSEVLSDLTQEVILTNGGALAHVNVTTGETRARIEWAPINDEDPAQDGWLHNVDLVRWRATP